MKQKRQYYSLIDKVYDMENLYEAWLKVRKNQGSGGIDGVTIEMFEKHVNRNLREIQRLLQENRYEPDPMRRHYIEKENGKLRPLGIPTIRERVCQQAVRQIIEPIFEQDFYYYSFGFRPGYSAHQAISTIRRAKRSGYEYVVDLDIMSFFDEMPHELWMEKVRERITDGRVLTLIRSWLTAGVKEDDQFYETEVGSPQGGVISPLLGNIHLNHFDWKMKEQGFAVVRYADDVVIPCKTKEKAEEAYVAAKTILEEELQLRMHPEKTKVVHFKEGFRFLGFDFWKDYLIVPEAKVKRYKDKIRKITRRQQGKNLSEMIKKLNEVVTASGFVAEIGNISRFKSSEKLARFSGIAPVFRGSGDNEKFYKCKQGNRALHELFYRLACRQIGTKRGRKEPKNPYYYDYYHQKLSAGKTKTQAIVCIMRKLVDLVYALMKNKTEYVKPMVQIKRAG